MRHLKGFSLVEALVAVLIVSVGLLGVGELVLNGLRAGSTALLRTQAVYLMADMMERIRANPDAGDAYDCANYSPQPVERGCAPSNVPALECAARELAEDDLARWQGLVRQSLPLRSSEMCAASVRYFASEGGTGPARYEIAVAWRQPGRDEGASLTGVLLVAGGGT